MRHKVVLATTNRWFATARLAMALKNAGFVVEAVCPSDHPLSKLSATLTTYPYHALLPESSIREALLESHADLCIPCDDLATALLQAIHRGARREESAGSWICTLIERSLGDPVSYAVSGARSKLIALAGELGIRVPKTTIVKNRAELDAWIKQNGLPAVLKTDGTSGGVGVKIVATHDQATQAFDALNSPPAPARVVKRAIVDRDINLLVPFLSRSRPQINIQSFIHGHDATSAVACWQGVVLASIQFDVVHTWKPKGPASVVRLIDNPEMASGAAKIVSRLRLSGLFGFDFMKEEGAGSAYLIEMNPRATQTCHLTLGPGKDLPAALWAIMAGERVQEAKSITEKPEIALFPQEWQRNPASRFLSTAYHDVPWDEPDLIRECMERRRLKGAFSPDGLFETYARTSWRR